MSDEESLNLEDVGAGTEEAASEGRKTGFLPGVLIRVLKWVAIGLAFIILGATTTVVTFSLVNRGRATAGVPTTSEEYRGKKPVLQWDDTIEEIRGVTADEVPAIFSVKVSIGYEPDNQQVGFELNKRRRQIQNLIFLEISNKTREELRPEYYEALQQELADKINRTLMKEGRIEELVFSEFVVTQ